MDITSVIDITISVATPAVTRLGFGEPLIYANNAIIPAGEMVRRYGTSTWSEDLIDDGFFVDDPVYLAAAAIAAQDIKPPTFKVARGVQAFSVTADLTMLTDAVGEQIIITLTGEDPAVPNTLISETYTRDCLGGGIPAEATAVAILITAGIWGVGGDITAVWPGGISEIVTITALGPYANQVMYYEDLHNADVEDTTPLRTVATDLDLIVAADADWYCLVAPDCGTLDTIACAAWVETQINKVGSFNTQDSEVLAGVGIGNTMRLANDNQSGLMYTQHSLAQNPGAAWAARHLPEDPGTEVWAFKGLTGVTPSELTVAEATAAHADFVNTYEGITRAGVTVVAGIAFKGWTSGLAETFMDNVRLVDALKARVEEELLALFTAARKVPYNDAGIGSIKAGILSAIRHFEGGKRGLLPGSAFCEVPKAADVSDIDKAARELNSVVFGAVLNGAIMKVTISATLAF